MKKNTAWFLIILSLCIMGYLFISAIADGTLSILLKVIFERLCKYFVLILAVSVIGSIYAIVLNKDKFKKIISWKTSFWIIFVICIIQFILLITLNAKYNELSQTFSKYRASMEGNYSGWTLEEIQKLFNNKY
ncbi:MAG: hypothetical protein SPL73_05665 [Cyanobacteriota bacterium]|nr:hypothetical protein [Cyanobacteriota bacterium]MDY6364359.1 hypothetical protein [Cyanobacteriota bacterium]